VILFYHALVSTSYAVICSFERDSKESLFRFEPTTRRIETDCALAGLNNPASLDDKRFPGVSAEKSERLAGDECDWWRAASDCPPEGIQTAGIRLGFAFTEFPIILRG
jgi:hypothetical protein